MTLLRKTIEMKTTSSIYDPLLTQLKVTHTEAQKLMSMIQKTGGSDKEWIDVETHMRDVMTAFDVLLYDKAWNTICVIRLLEQLFQHKEKSN